jgi:hypothetical protein
LCAVVVVACCCRCQKKYAAQAVAAVPVASGKDHDDALDMKGEMFTGYLA